MTIERRKGDRRVSPAVSEFALQERGELLARIAELEAERNRLLNNPKDVFKKMCDMALKQRDELEAQLLDVSAERNACQRARITATNGWKRECEDADSVFEALGIDMDTARTDGGSLRVTSVIAALKDQPSGVAQGIDIDAAAKVLAQRIDYPWDFMPEQGREAMREHAKSVIDAAGTNSKTAGSCVVLPERMRVPGPIWKDARQPYGNPLNASDISAAENFNLALDEVARLNACRAQSVSDGYVMVPVEPTEEMEQFVCNCDVRSGAVTGDYPEWQQCYKAMLAAAQSAKQESGDE